MEATHLLIIILHKLLSLRPNHNVTITEDNNNKDVTIMEDNNKDVTTIEVETTAIPKTKVIIIQIQAQLI